MKLTKRLTIGSQQTELVAHHIVLELSAGGRGILTVKGDVSKGQLISLDIGYNNQLVRYFTGYVAKVTPAGKGTNKIMVRELAGILAERYPVSIRHATMRQVITKLAEDTGLSFVIPEGQAYTDTPIANFTSQGTGYQLLNNLFRAFAVPDGVWYQQQDGQIYVGGYQQCRWATRPVEIPHELSQQQSNNNWKLLAMPAMRPGALVNKNRINQVELAGDTMTITWATNAADNNQLERQVKAAFPELAGGYHLPRFGCVVAISDSAAAGDINNTFRPRYAVDVQLLDENSQPDTAVPVYKAISLPVMFAGTEQGLLQYPLEGAIVEIGFAYGRADKPFIRTVLGTGFTLPAIEPGEQLQQQRAGVYQRTDTAGNQNSSTDQQQQHSAYHKITNADQYDIEAGSMHTKVQQHSIEEVAGKKVIEALGAVDVLAGDDLTLGALGNTRLAIAGELTETIGKLRHSVAEELQRFEAETHWAGTDTVNIYNLLDQLMQCVSQLADHCAKHKHLVGSTMSNAPDIAADMTSRKTDATNLHNTLQPIVAT
ncbi:MAG TPA: hypothetical protein DF774_10410 [Rheinheimera sp.]|uniref:hypothetical protein n=1 Tax=Rheinheimera sp. TaxID=1869214 RepID=UPI000EC05E15|nr:hypothetical protein [Rheinheimera sp.]HCU66159.1 hypothetical protein [Rheinheimera sp.]